MPIKSFDSKCSLDSLTGIRIFLALFVLIYHNVELSLYFDNTTYVKVGKILFNGPWGVQGFFVLSGFIMWYVYSERKNWTAKEFYINRFARIYPVYLLGILIVLFRGSNLPAINILDSTQFLKHLVLELLMVQSWGTSFGATQYFNGPGWTISLEAFFYLIFPLIFALYRKKKTCALVLIGAITIISLYATANKWEMPLCVLHLYTFMLGMLLCMVWKKTVTKISVKWSGFFLVISTVLLLLGNLIVLANLSLWTVFLFLPIIYGLASCDYWGKKTFFSNRMVVLGGEISYSVYIFHVPVHTIVISILYRLGFSPHDVLKDHILHFIISFPATIVVSYLAWKYIEKPLRFRIRKLLKT